MKVCRWLFHLDVRHPSGVNLLIIPKTVHHGSQTDELADPIFGIILTSRV